MSTSVKNELDAFGKYIVQQSRSNLTKAKKKDRGNLYKSIGYDVKVSKNSFELSFTMEDYGKFVDKGVKGVNSSAKAPNSPYKFGTGSGAKGGLTKGIDAWVQRKRFQFKDKKGKFLSYQSTAFIIRRSIWFTGLRTTNFFERPFELAFKRLPDDLIKRYGLDIDDLLDDALS
jgi:hypothetical protein